MTVYYPIMQSDQFVSAEEKLDELLMQKRLLMKSIVVPTDLTIQWKEFADVL